MEDFVYSNIDEVEVDVKVVLQIIKHSQDEPRSHDSGLDGYLTGMVKGGVCEVTHSFRDLNQNYISDDDYLRMSGYYQMNTLRLLREENQDHILAGFYKKVKNFNFLSKPDDFNSLIEFQRVNDIKHDGTVMLVYDESRMSQGDFGLRAFRVSEKGMNIYMKHKAESSKAFTVSNVKEAGLSFDDLLVELSISVKSSYLMNCLLLHMESERLKDIERAASSSLQSARVMDQYNSTLVAPAFNIASNSFLQEQSEAMKASIDEVYNDTHRFLGNQKNIQKATAQKHQLISKKKAENEDLIKKGEKPIPLDEADINKQCKMPEEFNRLNGMIHSFQSNLYCDSVKNYSTGNMGKLFMSEKMQEQ